MDAALVSQVLNGLQLAGFAWIFLRVVGQVDRLTEKVAHIDNRLSFVEGKGGFDHGDS